MRPTGTNIPPTPPRSTRGKRDTAAAPLHPAHLAIKLWTNILLAGTHSLLAAIVIEKINQGARAMRSVYEPSSAIQAHVLQDVLRQHGISSHVAGEHLQGAIGELPAGNLVRLLVSEEDWPAARRAVLEWESAPPMADDD